MGNAQLLSKKISYLENEIELLREERDEFFQKVVQFSQEPFFRIFNNLIDVYVETDLDGKILIISPSIEKHFGYQPEKLKNKNFSVLLKGRTSLKVLFIINCSTLSTC